MNIAIIGAGNVGKALAGSFVRAGHDVRVTSQHAEHAREAARQTGGLAVDDARQAADGADMIVLAVPYPSLEAVLGEIEGQTAGVVVVDVTNPLTADYSGLALQGTSAAEQIQSRLPAARVVKAFNTVLAARQADPRLDGQEIDGLVAGDDGEAKAAVMDLEGRMGLRPIDAGPLAMARVLEGMAFLNISLQLREGGAWQSGWRLIAAPV